MGQSENLIEEAIQYAKANGVRIVSGPVFNWCDHNLHRMSTTPITCNALGAVLLKLGKEHLVKESFDPSWLNVICKYLGVADYWIMRFVLGFDYGNQVWIISMKGDKEIKTKDDVSCTAIKLALKYTN